MLKKNLANIITSLRILGTLSLLWLTPLSTAWQIVYGLCGVTDVLDGTVARAMHIQSRFGAKLDSVSDLCFYAVMLVQLLKPLVLRLPLWIWYPVAAVIIIRIFDYSYAAVKFGGLASTHAILNKASGFCIFLLPYAMKYLSKYLLWYGCFIVLLTAFAAIYELAIHIRLKP